MTNANGTWPKRKWVNRKTGEESQIHPADAAGRARRERNLAAAEEARASSTSPTGDAEAHFTEGQEAFNKGKYELAVTCFTKALDAGGLADIPKVHSWRGVTHDFLKQHDAAFADHDRAVRMSDEKTLTAGRLLNRGKSHMFFSRFGAAEKDLLDALKRTSGFNGVSRVEGVNDKAIEAVLTARVKSGAAEALLLKDDFWTSNNIALAKRIADRQNHGRCPEIKLREAQVGAVQV